MICKSIHKLCGRSVDDFFALHMELNEDQVGYLARYRQGGWSVVTSLFAGWPFIMDGFGDLWFAQADVLFRVNAKNEISTYPLPGDFTWNASIVNLALGHQNEVYLHVWDDEKKKACLCALHGGEIEILHGFGKVLFRLMVKGPDHNIYFSDGSSKLIAWKPGGFTELDLGMEFKKAKIQCLTFDLAGSWYLTLTNGDVYHGNIEAGKASFQKIELFNGKNVITGLAFKEAKIFYLSQARCSEVSRGKATKFKVLANCLHSLGSEVLSGTESEGIFSLTDTRTFPFLEISAEEKALLKKKYKEFPWWESRNKK